MEDAKKCGNNLQTRNDSVRQELIIRYIPLVKYIVNRLTVKIPHFLDKEDLQSFGLMGLIEAANKFKPENGVKFETYATYRIKGAIIDEIRKANWLPRSMFQKIQLVSKTYNKLEQMGVTVKDQEVASATGLTLDELYEVMQSLSCLSNISLDEVIGGGNGDGVTAKEMVADTNALESEAVVEDKELKAALKKGLEKMEERDRAILDLYYNEELTLKEIGKVLDVSESRVCQLHGRALLRLKASMGELGYA